jgi:hypothetical protein
VADPSLPALLAAALRRLVFLLAIAAAVTALFSVAIGLLLGAGLSRSISLGFYAVGSFLLIAGFFVGNRGPVRAKSGDDPGLGLFGVFRNRRLRWASGSELAESLNLSFVFVAVGVFLIVLGVITDPRYKLV